MSSALVELVHGLMADGELVTEDDLIVPSFKTRPLAAGWGGRLQSPSAP